MTGCTRRLKARGLCHTHYERLRLHGDAGPAEMKRGWSWGEFQRLAAIDTDECVIWPHGTTTGGYGTMVDHDGVRRYVHRHALELHAGPAPTGMEAAHSCHTRRCMNARHLRWATVAENQADRIKDGTDHRGQRHPKAVLTDAQVLEIRALIGTDSQANIARRYGVSQQLVCDIKKGRAWKHL
jgi:hypothetical protein